VRHLTLKRVLQSAAILLLADGLTGLAALKGAGLTGTAPPNAGAFQSLISTLTSNWEWLIGTGIGLAFVLVAGLMIFGSQNAPQYLFKIIGGIMLILIVIPAVLA
jgi:type IV secretory pathway VirB2 component (pilin)